MTAAVQTRELPYELHPAGFILPRHRTAPLFDESQGWAVHDFAVNHLTVPKGPRVGEALEMHLWQRWAIDQLLEYDPDTGLYRHRQGLLGVARQNGKGTGIGTPLALEHIFEGEPGLEAYAVAGDREQARIIFGQARRQVLGSQYLSKRANVYRDAIEVVETGSIFRTLSSDASLAQGLSPSLVLFDEVHIQRDEELWQAMVQGTGARLNALVLGITTAGHDPDSLAGELYDFGMKVAAGEVDDPSFFMAWWEAAQGCSINDRNQWIAANPSLFEGTMSERDFVTAAKRNPGAFRRYRLNQWIRLSGEGWMDMDAWKAATATPAQHPTDELDEPPAGTPIVMTFDGSIDRDATVLYGLRLDTDKPVGFLIGAWERPEEDVEEWSVPRDEVNGRVEYAYRKWRVESFAGDPAWWRSEQQQWDDQYENVLEWPVTNARMGPACTDAYAAIVQGDVLHDGNLLVTRHVRNAIQKDLGPIGVTIKKIKRDSMRSIDAAVTFVMAIDQMMRRPKPKKPGKLTVA